VRAASEIDSFFDNLKPEMKVTLSMVACGAIFLSNLSVYAQSATNMSPQGDRDKTNLMARIPGLERIRRQMGDRNPIYSSLITRKDWEKAINVRNELTPSFTVEDGVYLLAAQPEIGGEAVQNSEAVLGGEDLMRVSNRVHIAFSYPSASSDASELSVPLGEAGNSAVATTQGPFTFNRVNSSHAEENLAWSDGASRAAADLGDYIPANAPLRETARPNVIIPEPNVLALFAIFGGALLIFSKRRATT
jgi:hypothetical protein